MITEGGHRPWICYQHEASLRHDEQSSDRIRLDDHWGGTTIGVDGVADTSRNHEYSLIRQDDDATRGAKGEVASGKEPDPRAFAYVRVECDKNAIAALDAISFADVLDLCGAAWKFRQDLTEIRFCE